MTYTVKREKIKKPDAMEAEEIARAEAIRGVECRRLLRRMLGVALVVPATVFGEMIAQLPTLAAFAVVFVYLCSQTYVWLK